MQLVAGSRLSSYEIIAPLGAGGMGEVYRARDAALKRDVAIKVLPEDWSRDPERLHRFEVEAQSTAALNHPNIVSIFHVGQQDGCPYIVTELLEGETLRDRLRRGPMRPREACDCGVEIARGLAAAHDAGIVHRDLKPENLFLTRDGRLKILDFGLAKLTQAEPAGTDADAAATTFVQQTEPGQVFGTVGYMAPEQVRGQAVDRRCDIFAFGVVLYEMLTGKRAFQKATSAETLSAILNEDPPPLAQLVQDLPPALQRIVSRCLEKKPERRFQHASDLGFALDALSDASETAIPGVSEAAARRNRIWIAAAVAAIAVAATLFAWWKQPPVVPMVESVTQLTSDGEVKANSGRLETDGSRIYFGEGTLGSYRIMQVAVTGGPTANIPTRLANFQFTALSQDGSYLLGAAGDAFVLPFWTVPLPSGEPRLLGSIVSQDADLFPDGRILFCLGNDIFVAEKDGSQPRKLLSVDGYPVEPSVSPDGERLVFTVWSPAHRPISIDEARADGSSLHILLSNSPAERLCCARWTPDGRYIVYRNRHEGRTDLWVLPMQTGLLHRSRFAGPTHQWTAFLSIGGFEPGWETDFCGRHRGAGGTGALRRKFEAVSPSAARGLRFRSFLFRRRPVGCVHRVPGSRAMAQPQRRIGSFAAHVPAGPSRWSLHFSGREAGGVYQFRGCDLRDRYGRRIAADYCREGRVLAALVAGRKPPSIHGSGCFAPYPRPRFAHRQEFSGSRTGRPGESAVGGRRSASRWHAGPHKADGL